MELNRPSLTEFNTKYFVRHSLKETRNFKDKYITIFVNIFLFILFVGTIGGLLYYKYKGKLTPEEKAMKERQRKLYLFQKLQQYSHDKQKERQQLITNLPVL